MDESDKDVPMQEDTDENSPQPSGRRTAQHGTFPSVYGDPSSSGEGYRFPYESAMPSNLPSQSFDGTTDHRTSHSPALHGSGTQSVTSALYERQRRALHGPIVREGFIRSADQSDDGEDDEDEDGNGRSMLGVTNFNYPEVPPSPEPFGPAYEATGFGNDSTINRSALLHSVLDANNQTADPDFAVSDGQPSNGTEEMSDSDEVDFMRGEGRRGAARGRGRGRGRPRGSRARGRVPRGEGSRGGRRGKRGPRAVADPGHEFKEYQREAVKAHLEERYEDALKYARKAVKTNPEIFAAHSLLSHALDNLGRKKDALLALWSGAHTQRDPKVWWHVANGIMELGGPDRNKIREQVYQCYSEIIRLDSNDYEARAERLTIQLELEQWGKAKRECITMLKIRPHDVDVLRTLADMCGNMGEPEQALTYYEAAIDNFINGANTGEGEFTWSLLNVYLDILDSLKRYPVAIQKLRALARWLLNRQEESFWDAQSDDREWDMEDFPRRTDVKDFVPGKYSKETYGAGLPMELRIKLGLFRLRVGPQQRDEALRHFDLLEPEDLSPNAKVFDYSDLFQEVADGLRTLSYYGDALRFYEPLLAVPEVVDNSYTSIHHSLAICYRGINRPHDAERCYKNIVDYGNQYDGNNRGGEEANRRLEARVELAKLYEELGMFESALPIVKDLLKMGKRDVVIKANLYTRGSTPDHDADNAADGAEPAQETTTIVDKLRKDPPQPRKRKERVAVQREGQERQEREQFRDSHTKDLYTTLKPLHEAVVDGEEQATEEWMRIAELMIQDFRSMKLFFPRRDKHIRFVGYQNKRHKDPDSKAISEINAMAKRLRPFAEGDEEFNVVDADGPPPDEFRDIPFDEWCDIFCLYALNLAKSGDGERCWDVINAASTANVFFHHDHRIILIETTWLACALLLGNEQYIYEKSRWFVKRFPYASDAYRMYSAANRLYTGLRTWYNSGPSQKYILRQIKAMDYAMLDTEGRKAYQFTEQEIAGWTESGKNDGNPCGITELDPALLTLYGHILATGGAYPSALNYYFRAYVLNPEDVMINLSIATCFIQHALKRQSENRQYQIQQGLAFLFRYYELRTKGDFALHIQEAEFNVGRIWHMLGLLHLALPAYEKCLELSKHLREEQEQGGETAKEDVEDFGREAAFAIRMILATDGDMEAARSVTEEWLVI